MNRPRAAVSIIIPSLPALFLGTVAVWPDVSHAAWPAPLASPRGAVSTDHELASKAGAEILAKGGNAVDAAVAAALALGVVQPSGSGIGGGGFLVARMTDGTLRVLDFRETAPKKAHRDMYLDPATGKVRAELSRTGGLAVAVPGEPAGLGEALRTLGTLSPAQVIAPALRLAREGFPAGAHFAASAALVGPQLPAGASKDIDALRGLLLINGVPVRTGQTVHRPELGATLAAMAQRGFGAFYKGEIADQIVRSVQAAGGVLTAEDMSSYRPEWRTPLSGSYRGWQIHTAPPPAGGLTSLEALQILDARPPLREGPLASSTLHALSEAFKHAFADRARLLGDPAFVEVPTEELAAPAYARQLAGRLRDDGVLPASRYGKGGPPRAEPHDHGTTHLCAMDAHGNVAALTTTVNHLFGAKLVAGRTGVIVNNQMDDFSAQPGAPNAFGLVGADANAIAAGKRPLSSMSPLVAVGPDGTLVCVGASGGPTIVTGTVQALVNVVEFKLDAAAAVSAPRIHAQFVPPVVTVEPFIPPDVQEGLRRRGHALKILDEPMITAVQMVIRRPAGANAAIPAVPARPVYSAGADPRKGGTPAAP